MIGSGGAHWLGPLVCGAVLVCGCTPTGLKPDPHYVLGPPYKTGSVWFYPREAYDLDETGIAAITRNDTSRLTTDHEVFDQMALAGAHPAIQLPAIVRVTNLQNGREVMIRLNDRGSGDPRRLLEVTRQTASLLGIPADGVARVRLFVLANESHAAADGLPGAPALAIIAAPRGSVEIAELAPSPSVRQARSPVVPRMPAAPVLAMNQPLPPPLRLPETVTQTVARPGRLMVRLDTFDDYRYAVGQRARMGGTEAHVVTVTDRRAHRFRVEIGPLPDVASADKVLDQALSSGIPDARIVVD